MRTRYTNARRMWRCVLPVLILYLSAAPIFAQASQSVIGQSVPQVPAGQKTQAAQGGTSAADYRHDVALAVALQNRLRLEAARYGNDEIDKATYEASAKIFTNDYMRLYWKWNKVGKGADLERDYKQRLNAMPWPVRKPRVMSAPSADYQRDVEQAADLVFQQGQVAKRSLNKEIDNASYLKSVQGLAARLTTLTDKWQAAGRENQFKRDYMQRVTAMAIVAKSEAETKHRRLVYIGSAVVGIILLYLLFLGKKPAKRFISDIYGTAPHAPCQHDNPDE